MRPFLARLLSFVYAIEHLQLGISENSATFILQNSKASYKHKLKVLKSSDDSDGVLF